jgi:tryptophanyl-tRNA synthetase
VVKRRLEAQLQAMIEPIRTRREAFAQDKGEVLAMLKRGTERARAVAAKTLSEVNAAMGLNYFD